MRSSSGNNKMLALTVFYFITSLFNLSFGANEKISNARGLTALLKAGYGPYLLKTIAIETCTPTILYDEENKINSKIYVFRASRTVEEFKGNITIVQDLKITGAIVKSEVWEAGGFITLLTRKLKQPCEHITLGYLLGMLMKPDKECNVLKGDYELKAFNPNDIMHTVIAKFNYARYAFNFELQSSKGAILCLRIIAEAKIIKEKKIPPSKPTKAP